jgi:hypothetical protein
MTDKDQATPEPIIQMTNKVPTVKTRYLAPSGNAFEFFLYVNTTPEDMDNLVQNALEFENVALNGGFISANQTAGAKAIRENKTGALKEQFGIRGENELHKIVSLDIDPQRDGRVKVSFFGDSFKQPRDDYASASLLLSPADMQEALAKYYKFKLGTFQKLGTFAVDFYVETYLSTKLNSAGKPYKNVPKGGIHVAEGAAPPAISEFVPPPQQQEQPPQQEAPPEPDDIPF